MDAMGLSNKKPHTVSTSHSGSFTPNNPDLAKAAGIVSARLRPPLPPNPAVPGPTPDSRLGLATAVQGVRLPGCDPETLQPPLQPLDAPRPPPGPLFSPDFLQCVSPLSCSLGNTSCLVVRWEWGCCVDTSDQALSFWEHLLCVGLWAHTVSGPGSLREHLLCVWL